MIVRFVEGGLLQYKCFQLYTKTMFETCCGSTDGGVERGCGGGLQHGGVAWMKQMWLVDILHGFNQDCGEKREKLESWRTILEEYSDYSEERYSRGAGKKLWTRRAARSQRGRVS